MLYPVLYVRILSHIRTIFYYDIEAGRILSLVAELDIIIVLVVGAICEKNLDDFD